MRVSDVQLMDPAVVLRSSMARLLCLMRFYRDPGSDDDIPPERCHLYSGHFTQRLQRTAGFTDKRNIKPSPGWNLFDQCCSLYQAVQ